MGVLSFPQWVWRLCLLHVCEIKVSVECLLLFCYCMEDPLRRMTSLFGFCP